MQGNPDVNSSKLPLPVGDLDLIYMVPWPTGVDIPNGITIG